MKNGIKTEPWFNAIVDSRAKKDSLSRLPRWEVKSWSDGDAQMIQYISRYEGGLTEYERSFRNGLPHAEWRHFYPSGALRIYNQYELGRKIFELIYNDEGDTLHFQNFAPE